MLYSGTKFSAILGFCIILKIMGMSRAGRRISGINHHIKLVFKMVFYRMSMKNDRMRNCTAHEGNSSV